MSAQPTLWHLAISHYSEKVRWALDYKAVAHERRTVMPGYHIPLALWLTRGGHFTLPILGLEGDRIGDSTAIIAALEARFPEPALYPADPAERRRALELEEWFDEQLGPHIRRYVFHEARGEGARFDELAARSAPPALARYQRMAGAYARALTAARFGAASDRGARRSRDRVLLGLDRLESELGAGEYLVGDRFTVADLTAAALFYPLVLPPDGPVQDVIPEAIASFREPLSKRRGFTWVTEMFRRHRRRREAQGQPEPPVAAPAP